MWSLGATLAELATGQPLLPGLSAMDQLCRTMRACGPLPPDLAAAAWRHPHLRPLATCTPASTRTLRQRLQVGKGPQCRVVLGCPPSLAPSGCHADWHPSRAAKVRRPGLSEHLH